MISCSGAVFAQETKPVDSTKIETLDEVFVTATRTERQLSSLPLPTSIILSSDIIKAGVTKLNEILSEQTGIITVPDFGGGEGVQIQGMDSAYTLILVDGVPLIGRSAGTLDLYRISVGNIDRIEIVKGASSALYGSEALAGVINIITKRPKYDMFAGGISERFATFNTHDVNGNLIWKKKKFSGTFFTNYHSTDGYDFNDQPFIQTVEPNHDITVQPRFYYDFSDKLTLIAGLRFYKNEQDYKAIIEDENCEGKSDVDEWGAQFRLEHKWNSKIESEYEFYSTNYKAEEFLNNPEGQRFDDSFYNQWLFRPEIRTTFSINKDKLTTGVGVNHETLERTYFDNRITFDSQYFYVQYDYNPIDKLNILAGFRYDIHNQFQSQLSPKLAMNYKISPSISLKTSFGYGFKAPDFRQLYFDFTNSSVGYTVLGYNVAENRLDTFEVQGQLLSRVEGISFSDHLKPESSVNFNLGSLYQKGKLKMDVNAFYNSITNLIDTRVVAQKTNGQNVFSYFNINEIFTYGIEYNATYKFSSDFRVSFGYQYMVAKDKSVIKAIENGEVFARDPITLESFQLTKSDYFGLFNRSKHIANIKLYYSIPKIKTDVSLRVIYRSKFGLFDTNSNQILDIYDDFVNEYYIANLSLSKSFKDKITLQVGANNLFDFTNPREISNIPGRQVFGKLQFNF
ncbi:TonB-dependent receptor plug domain-containing protein [Flavobacterium wongokense]|uniref:TonB-dependent receptor plug domain-containing protein n=1 Tax=Flavobacterium wongokense TaxID=2910674 RepID=UPI001F37D093|nr:TonB-dependent receptor [Flavobacterium sp. WG47]MCF6132019.1 TonB-dependent receptor [Flavobacterium sp. WG47]